MAFICWRWNGKTLVISLSRPGYLIGKGGRLIKAFTEYLQKLSSSEIKINLKRFDPLNVIIMENNKPHLRAMDIL